MTDCLIGWQKRILVSIRSTHRLDGFNALNPDLHICLADVVFRVVSLTRLSAPAPAEAHALGQSSGRLKISILRRRNARPGNLRYFQSVLLFVVV